MITESALETHSEKNKAIYRRTVRRTHLWGVGGGWEGGVAVWSENY